MSMIPDRFDLTAASEPQKRPPPKLRLPMSSNKDNVVVGGGDCGPILTTITTTTTTTSSSSTSTAAMTATTATPTMVTKPEPESIGGGASGHPLSASSSSMDMPDLEKLSLEKALDAEDLDDEAWLAASEQGKIVELDSLGEGAGGAVTRCKLKGGKTVFALKVYPYIIPITS